MKNYKNDESVFESDLAMNGWLIKAAIVVFTVILSICAVQAQSSSAFRSIGLGAEISSGGNGHSAFLSPYVTLIYNDHALIVSPLFLNQDHKFYGLKVAHSLNLSNSKNYYSEDEDSRPLPLQLNFYSYLQYLGDCPASNDVIRYENLKRRGNEVSHNISLSTAEAGAGIELRINLSRSVSIRNCIGLAFYRHLGEMDLIFHERSSCHLNLSSGLQFTIS